MIKGIIVQVDRLNDGHDLSLSLKDVCDMIEFGLALCGQISNADKVNTGNLISECFIGSALFSCFATLVANNFANKIAKEKYMSYQDQLFQPTLLDNSELNAQIASLEHLYHLR